MKKNKNSERKRGTPERNQEEEVDEKKEGQRGIVTSFIHAKSIRLQILYLPLGPFNDLTDFLTTNYGLPLILLVVSQSCPFNLQPLNIQLPLS